MNCHLLFNLIANKIEKMKGAINPITIGASTPGFNTENLHIAVLNGRE